LIKINSLEERNNLVQNTEPHESWIVLNRLPCNTWSLMGIQSFLVWIINFLGNNVIIS